MSVDLQKLKEAIIFIAANSHVRDLGKTKLFKLLFFFEQRCIRQYEVEGTRSEFIKYEYGPVPSRGGKALKQLEKDDEISVEEVDSHGFVMHMVSANRHANLSVFSPLQIRALEETCASMGHLTACDLSERSHKEPAWQHANLMEKLDPVLIEYGACEDQEGL